MRLGWGLSHSWMRSGKVSVCPGRCWLCPGLSCRQGTAPVTSLCPTSCHRGQPGPGPGSGITQTPNKAPVPRPQTRAPFPPPGSPKVTALLL